MGSCYVEVLPRGEDDAGLPGGAGDAPRSAATLPGAGVAMPGASNAGHAAQASSRVAVIDVEADAAVEDIFEAEGVLKPTTPRKALHTAGHCFVRSVRTYVGSVHA